MQNVAYQEKHQQLIKKLSVNAPPKYYEHFV